MADARGSGARGRPRGAAKIKVASKPPTTSTTSNVVSPSKPQVVLPKLKPSTTTTTANSYNYSSSYSNNNNNNDKLTPFSPRAKEIPVALPLAPRPPPLSLPHRPPAAAAQATVTSFTVDGDSSGPPSFDPSLLSAKTAWSTPRSPVPEIPTSELSTSALESFFHTEVAGSVETPSRLLSAEESLLASEQLYRIDWSKLQTDSDKFLEISATASQHLDALLQTELPQMASAGVETKAALLSLALEIASLHDQHDADREKLLQEFDALFTQQTDERLTIMDAHVAEKRALVDAHDREIQELTAEFQQQIHTIESESAVLETNCLHEIEELKQRMASELEQLREKGAHELEELRSRSEAEQERLQKDSLAKMEQLRATSEEEMVAYRSSSEKAYQQLLTESQHEINELKSSSALEIERLLESSASTLEEVTSKLTTELTTAQNDAAAEIQRLKSEHSRQTESLRNDAASAVAQLKQRHAEELQRLETEREHDVRTLQAELTTATSDHLIHVQQLTAKYTAELTTTKTSLSMENATMVKSYTSEIQQLRETHAAQMQETVAAYDAQLDAANKSHAEQLELLVNKTAAEKDVMVAAQESQIRSLHDDAKREKDRLVLRYESDLELLRRTTCEQLEISSRERDETIQQLREAHASRVLALETLMRENDKRYAEETTLLGEQLTLRALRIEELVASEANLVTQKELLVERSREQTTRLHMRLEEMHAAIAQLEREGLTKDATIDALTKDLRASDEDRHVKSNTILELTFVITSRDEEIEKLQKSLLDTIQNVNAKTEILELTAETLSSKAKELEDAKTALRLESGRLSRVEEDRHHKVGMLEDSELKIENMRLQSETLRLEMKRLQMDMKLQHEHSAGEMELKQGEIRRLHAAQTELKQKNDIHQETIARLETSLANAVRQCDEQRRKMELLRLETSQHVDDARKLGDLLLEKETALAVVTKESQTLQRDKHTLTIQLSNLQTVAQLQRERVERSVMLVEDVHCQYQRRLEMTAAEKDARLRHERHLLLLEVAALKDSLVRLEGVETKLQSEELRSLALETSLQEVAQEKTQLLDQIQQLTDQLASQNEAFTKEHSEVSEQQRRVEELEKMVAQTTQELREKDAQVSLVANDASSLSSVLHDKDQQLSAMQTRLDSAVDEAARLVTSLAVQQAQLLEAESSVQQQRLELGLLREKLAESEQLCAQRDASLQQLEHASQSHVQELRGYQDRETELQAALTKEQRDKSMLAQAHQEGNAQLQYLVGVLKREEDTHVVTKTQLQRTVAEKSMQAQAHQEANAQLQYLVSVLKREEDTHLMTKTQLQRVTAEKSLQAQAHQEANAQLQYLVGVLKREEDAHVVTRMQLRERLEQDTTAMGSLLAEVQQSREKEVAVLREELEALAAAHATQHQQLEQDHQQALLAVQTSSSQAMEALREELTMQLAQAQQQRDDAITSLEERHVKQVAEAEMTWQLKLQELQSRVAETEELLATSRLESDQLVQQVADLQQQIREKDRALSESQEVIRVRKATIENVRKEMALLMGMQRLAPVETRRDQEDGDEESGAEDGEKYSAGGEEGDGAVVVRPPPLGSMLPLIRQRLETFVVEELHAELPADFQLRDDSDLLAILKDVMRVRHCLSEVTRPRAAVLSIQEVCSAVAVLQQITAIATEPPVELSVSSLPGIQTTVTTKLRQGEELRHQLRELLGLDGTATDESCRDTLAAYAPVFARLRELKVSDTEESIHVARSAAFLQLVDDYETFTASQRELLLSAQTQLECEQPFQSLDDLQVLLREASWLRRTVASHIQQVSDPEIHLPEIQQEQETTHNLLRSRQVASLLDERRAFISEISQALEFPPLASSSQTPELNQQQQQQPFLCVHLVDAVRELMRVVHAFESLSPSSSSSSFSTASDQDTLTLPVRVQAILAFVDELRLVTQFAQTILDEEADATALPDSGTQSHASSSSSLLFLRDGVLTRTPTPTTELDPMHADHHTDIGDPDGHSGDSRDRGDQSPHECHEELFLSDDALAPTEPHDGDKDPQAADGDLKSSNASSALSDSLLDISLVMNDHHRILSEAAHWVTKAHSMSPRSKKTATQQQQQHQSLDFATALTQLVRDHCALLSLARKLFRLQDPRQDLPSVLQCLAVLSRLTSRLAFLDGSGSTHIQANDSSESLRSETSSSSHEKLKHSLSVFASMDQVARHLQDFDALLSRLSSSLRGSGDFAGDLTETVETLSDAVDKRLGLVEQVRGMLGLTDPLMELPAFVAFLQNVVQSSTLAPPSDNTEENEAVEGAFVGVDAIQSRVQHAVQASDRLEELLAQLREVLPFASSVESPTELVVRLQETIAQCETLMQDKHDAMDQVRRLTEQLAIETTRREDEDAVIQSVYQHDNGEVERVDVDRIEKLRQLLDELRQLRENTAEMEASIAEEETLLGIADEVEKPSRVETVRALIQAQETLQLQHKELKDQLTNSTKLLEDERRELQHALAEERRFLVERGVVCGEEEPRQAVYERLLSELESWRTRDAKTSSEIAEEVAFLQQHQLTLSSESDVFASRMAVYKTLLDAQHVWMEDKMEREVQDQQQRALLEREGIPIASGEDVVKRLIETFQQLTKLQRDVAAEQELRDKHAKETLDQERVFLEANGLGNLLEPGCSGRIAIYQSLLQRVEVAKSALAAWDGSPHGDARGCQLAETQHHEELTKRMEDQHEAVAQAVKEALEKQAQQLAFRRSVLGEHAEEHTPPVESSSEAKIAELLEAFTQRDNTAIRRVYRLIRLATDILNTSAFSGATGSAGSGCGGGGGGGGGGEIPVELTQSVMACVKELKQLKEYLLESHAQICKATGDGDSAWIALEDAQELTCSREQLTDHETSMDLTLLLHRAYVARVNRVLLNKTQAMDRTISRLQDCVATHSDVLSETEAQCMQLEMQLASETSARHAAEANATARDEFVTRFSDERRQVEAALQRALEDAKQEREELLKKLELLEQDKNEALAQVHANATALSNGFMATPLLMTPRTPLSMGGGGGAGGGGGGVVVPMRPDKPRELTSSRLKTGVPGTGTAHKERFVSDLEKETGQRRTTGGGSQTQTQTSAAMPPMSARRANEWKRHELLSSSMQIEQQFRAMNETAGGHNYLAISSPTSSSPSSSDHHRPSSSSASSSSSAPPADQELWYQGVRMVQHISFFVSLFFVPRQKMFRVEVFNSDTEQQQTVYVTLDEMQSFVSESKRATRHGITLEDATKHSDVVDVLFERVKVLGGGDGTNLLFSFQ